MLTQIYIRCSKLGEGCTWLVTVLTVVVMTTSLAIYQVVQGALRLIVPETLPCLLPSYVLPILPIELAARDQRDEPERAGAGKSLDCLEALATDRPESFLSSSQHVVHEPLPCWIHKGLLHPAETDEEHPTSSIHDVCKGSHHE